MSDEKGPVRAGLELLKSMAENMGITLEQAADMSDALVKMREANEAEKKSKEMGKTDGSVH